MLEFSDYSLRVGNKELIEHLNITFASSTISHILGNNGVGKSCLAKSCINMLNYKGRIISETMPTLVGSYSNVPLDLRLKDVQNLLLKNFTQTHVHELINLLNLTSIPTTLKLKKMSDGQKQKIKLLSFLSSEPSVIILDEFTNALDKKSTLDIYKFLNKYVYDSGITCLNITHNLSDVEYMQGRYYFFSDKKIKEVPDKQQVIDLYVKGGTDDGVTTQY